MHAFARAEDEACFHRERDEQAKMPVKGPARGGRCARARRFCVWQAIMRREGALLAALQAISRSGCGLREACMRSCGELSQPRGESSQAMSRFGKTSIREHEAKMLAVRARRGCRHCGDFAMATGVFPEINGRTNHCIAC
jgi:hypothetical protein